MLLFYLDEPLSDEEAVQIAEALADAGECPEVVQKRISFLYAVGESAAANNPTELLSACLARTGLGDREVCALSIPRDGSWRADVLADAFYRMTRRNPYMSLANLGVATIDLIQFHVWEDAWATDPQWQYAIEALKREKMIRAVGISINRWEPWNALETVRSGMIDAVQVIYNIFDQAPEDDLFPLCKERGVGVIARVPLDEGTLTGNLTKKSHWAEGDWRNSYFVPENLAASVAHAEALKSIVPSGMTMAEMALRFILENETVSTIIPGMRKEKNVRANLSVSDGCHLSSDLMRELQKHRWDRTPTEWSH